MKRNRKAMMAAGLLAGAAALTGCSAKTTPGVTPTPQAARQITAQPDTAEATVSPDESPASGDEETPIALRVDGQEIKAGAVMEQDTLFLPLEETAKALGWEVESEETQEETLTRRSVQLSRADSRITVAWVDSDNTVKQLTWQKDGLLIPVDAQLTSVNGVIYVPAAFFETAMRVQVDAQREAVAVYTPVPQETPANDADDADKNEEKEGAENG